MADRVDAELRLGNALPNELSPNSQQAASIPPSDSELHESGFAAGARCCAWFCGGLGPSRPRLSLSSLLSRRSRWSLSNTSSQWFTDDRRPARTLAGGRNWSRTAGADRTAAQSATSPANRDRTPVPGRRRGSALGRVATETRPLGFDDVDIDVPRRAGPSPDAHCEPSHDGVA